MKNDTLQKFASFMEEAGDFPDRVEFEEFVQEARDGDETKVAAIQQYMEDSEGENPLFEKGIYSLMDIYEQMEENSAED